jgi:quinol monooxygenase YgiN
VSELVGIARFTFHPGKVEEFKRLSARCIEIVRDQDTGTLQYDVFLNERETEAVVVERYRDSQALIEHAEHVSDLVDPIVATASVTGELLGDASDELRANMSEGPVRLFAPYLSL